jgi:hypothetical protein
MASRPLIIASLLGATIGVPYVASRSSSGDNPATSQPATTTPSSTALPPPLLPMQSNVAPASLNPAPLGGVRFHSIDQVLRFDLTKQWVYSNWARKSTGPTDVGLFSVRVPLVTGTQTNSLAGSLTYYFNAFDQVEHISFRGRTGDPAPLTAFLIRTYEFQRAEAPVGEQLYQVTRSGRAQSEFRTRPESVIRAIAPHNSFAVELELARPGSKRFLPPRGPILNVPGVGSPSTSITTSDGASAATTESEASGGSFLNKFRYATPNEESQVLWKRWPN